jgi:hypothetical protein
MQNIPVYEPVDGGGGVLQFYILFVKNANVIGENKNEIIKLMAFCWQ